MSKKSMSKKKPRDLRGLAPESWCCIDCGFNTAPDMRTREEIEHAFNVEGRKEVPQTIGDDAEVYMVSKEVWKATGLEGYGGCLCIGCLEQRIGRFLRPEDFSADHPFHALPGTPRLLSRRDGGLLNWAAKATALGLK